MKRGMFLCGIVFLLIAFYALLPRTDVAVTLLYGFVGVVLVWLGSRPEAVRG